MKILDTTFLIDLQHERRRKAPGCTLNYLLRNPAEIFHISVISVTEYEEGFLEDNLSSARDFLGVFVILEIDLAIARIAGRVRRSLRTSGQIIGDHDILIASTAIAHNATLLTDNVGHFERIESLQVESYRN